MGHIFIIKNYPLFLGGRCYLIIKINLFLPTPSQIVHILAKTHVFSISYKVSLFSTVNPRVVGCKCGSIYKLVSTAIES